MPKKLFTAVAGLEPFAGVKPTGVQVRVRAQTGPFVPRFIDDEEGLILLLACQRGDITLKHLDDQPVLRIDLEANEILEVTDHEAGHDLIRRMRSERDRAISEASGYDGTTTGTVLTPDEVAAARRLTGGAFDGAVPSLEEAQAWWAEQAYVDEDYEDVVPSVIAELVGRISLNEIEYIATLEGADGYEASPQVLAAINKRMEAHADAVNAPGWSPLEAGLPIVEVRRRLATISDARIVADLLESEKKGAGRKRVLQAVDARLEQLGGVATAAEGVPASKVEELVGNLEESVAAAKAAVPPLPGEDEPVAVVDEEPFG
jgi:hypothetical protein